MNKLVASLASVAVSSIVFYFVAVLFGAPITHSAKETLTFSIILSCTTVLPLAIIFRSWEHVAAIVFASEYNETTVDFIVQRVIFGSVLGAWLGAWPIPLDWDRWWQEWPISCVFGNLAGAVLALLYCSLKLCMRKGRMLPSQALKHKIV